VSAQGVERIRYRRATLDDLAAGFSVFAIATHELMAQHGFERAFPASMPPPAYAFRRHALAHDSDGFWVAEDGRTLIGACIAIRRESLWYLAELHVLPGHQGRGVGRRLLELAISTRKASDRLAVTANSIQPASNGLYVAVGMLPWIPVLNWEGPLRHELPKSRASMDFRVAADARDLVAIDQAVLGWAKEVDHHFMQERHDLECGVLCDSGRKAGYAYFSNAGRIGPAAVIDEEFMEPLLSTVVQHLHSRHINQIALSVPGPAAGAYAIVRRFSLKLAAPTSMLLTSCALWTPGHYLVAGGDAPL
jgi:GNAT superfamily N-acetyltransferase